MGWHGVEGGRQLEMASVRWGPDDFIGWLRSGFAELDRKQGTLEEYLAFMPLRFHPESSALGQLLTFLSAASRDGSRLAGHARIAVHDYLKDYAGIRMDDEEHAFVANLWRIYPSLAPGAELVALARKYVNAIADAGDSSPGTDELVGIIVAAVASMPTSTLQMSFFMHLAERGRLWKDAYMLLLADRYLDWSPTPRQGWCELRMLFGPEIDAALDPAAASGRALIGLLAERLIADGVPDLLDMKAASNLKHRMYELDGDSGGPFVGAEWPKAKELPPSLDSPGGR